MPPVHIRKVELNRTQSLSTHSILRQNLPNCRIPSSNDVTSKLPGSQHPTLFSKISPMNRRIKYQSLPTEMFNLTDSSYEKNEDNRKNNKSNQSKCVRERALTDPIKGTKRKIEITTSDDNCTSEQSYRHLPKLPKYFDKKSVYRNKRKGNITKLYVLSRRQRRSRRLKMRSNGVNLDNHNVITPTDHRIQSVSVSKAIKKLETVEASKRPNELIRYDFISAMKLSQRHALAPGEYWTLQDKWKTVWHRGVHVPVSTLSAKDMYKCWNLDLFQSRMFAKLRLKNKVISYSISNSSKNSILNRSTLDDTSTRALTWVTCLYDADAMDMAWLDSIQQAGVNYTQNDFERCIIAFEFSCAEGMRQSISKCLTYDRNIVCDVCRSPDACDGDEMVFCDGCDVCVHQSCYGITELPTGDWLCGPCAKGFSEGSVNCVLCGCGSGALKPIFQCISENPNNIQKWCHICCALWIPETRIGDLKKMEPIIGVHNIPPARWSLICYLCRLRQGACVQCSLPSCRKAFHVTCALHHNLKMDTTSTRKRANMSRAHSRNSSPSRQAIKPSRPGSIFVAYCDEHSTLSRKHRRGNSFGDSASSVVSPSKNSIQFKNKLNVNKCIAKKRRLTPPKIARYFFKFVNINEVSYCLRTDPELVRLTYLYWVDKRKENQNKRLIETFPSSKTIDYHQWSALHDYLGLDLDPDVCKLNLIALRQQLEVVRNVSYLVMKREKLKRDAVILSAARYSPKSCSELKNIGNTTLSTKLDQSASNKTANFPPIQRRSHHKKPKTNFPGEFSGFAKAFECSNSVNTHECNSSIRKSRKSNYLIETDSTIPKRPRGRPRKITQLLHGITKHSKKPKLKDKNEKF